MDTPKLFLLDAYALIFRAYYALIKMPRITGSGFNTSAIFGFVNTLEEVLRKECPSHIAVCFDPAGPTFRHEASEQYKSERAETPEDIRLAVPYIKRIIDAYGIKRVECEGFEADDVIGTLAKIAENEGYITYMMTPDKDFGQLVTDTVFQYKPAYRGQDFELRGPAEVCERYGLQSPAQVIDLLALMGDKIDNIPGCPGVGEKTAVKLINDFGSVENLLRNTDSLKGALRRKVEENAEQIEFSKFLATIRTDVPVGVGIADLRTGTVDRDSLFAIFDELEFRTLRQRVAKRLDAGQEAVSKSVTSQPSLFDFVDEPQPPAPVSSAASEWERVESDDDVARLRSLLAEVSEMAMVMVAEGDSEVTARLVGTVLALPDGSNRWLPADNKAAMALLLDTMARPDILKISPDSKRDYVIAARLKGCSQPLVNYYDNSLAHYLLQPEQRHDPVTLAEQYLHRRIEEDVAAGGRKGATVMSERLAVEAARATLDLYPLLNAEVKREKLDSLLTDMEIPLAEVLAEMELTGVRIDEDALNAAAAVMRERIALLESEIHTLAGIEFNIGSPAKVGEVLFDRLHLDSRAKRTKSGQYSTSEEVLIKLAPLHPIVEKILLHRSLRKLLNTYLTALPSAINPATGRVHTTYNQTITATGRLSSSNPNLQNIPVRDDEGREIRRAFIASEGCLFLSADYSQIELRLVADFANEETMIDAFRHGRDIHAITAARIYHEELDKVSADHRRHAKTANFGILYGISAFGLSGRLGIPRAEAKALIDGYFDTFPAIRGYMTDAVEKARSSGVVRTCTGRRRFLPDINSRNPVVRGYAERNAINAPIQGSAADIIKKAMVDIYRRLKEENLQTRMIMQVHDELNFDVPKSELQRVRQIVTECMENARVGKVPLTASMGVADNWLDAH